MESIRILTVDKLASACDFLTHLAGTFGYKAWAVTQVEDFLPSLRKLNPHLLLFGPSVGRKQIQDFVMLLESEKNALPMLIIGGNEDTLQQNALPPSSHVVFLPESFHPADLEDAVNKLAHRTFGSDRFNELDALIVGQCPAMMALKRHVLQVCDSDLTVLISGESGTGKEVVARAVHMFSPRAAKPFVKVNSAGVPGHLFESELFGYKKGAFTGAYRSKPGKFQIAHSGTILLDEIGEISLPLQAKLLQVLEDNELSPLGSIKNTKIDTRVLAATNARLDKMVAQRRFRLDLFYRLSVISIHIPPLRERRADIELLSEHFLRKYAFHYNKPYRPLSEEVRKRFYQYDWPGNVRQLENAVRCFVAMGNADAVVPAPPGVMKPYTLREVCKEAVRRAEKSVIEQVLWHTDWNRKRAASLLKTSYRNLLNKIKEYEIEPEIANAQPTVARGLEDPWNDYLGYQPGA